MFKWTIRVTIFILSFLVSLFVYSYSIYAEVIQQYNITSLGVLNDTSVEVQVNRSSLSQLPSIFNYVVFDNGNVLQQYPVSTDSTGCAGDLTKSCINANANGSTDAYAGTNISTPF
jgi:hypothetical protein